METKSERHLPVWEIMEPLDPYFLEEGR